MLTVSKLTKSDVSEKLVETEMGGTRLVFPGEGFVFVFKVYLYRPK